MYFSPFRVALSIKVNKKEACLLMFYLNSTEFHLFSGERTIKNYHQEGHFPSTHQLVTTEVDYHQTGAECGSTSHRVTSQLQQCRHATEAKAKAGKHSHHVYSDGRDTSCCAEQPNLTCLNQPFASATDSSGRYQSICRDTW